MKTFTLTILLSLTTMITFAQSKNHLVEMEQGIAVLDTMKTPFGASVAVGLFEKIALTEANWLPQYYAAYSNLLAAIRGNDDPETKDYRYDKALKYISKADSLSPNNSEIFALKGYVIFMKMAVYPQKRAMQLIPLANQLIEKAIMLDPENPRAHLLKGQNMFYTPEMFGGGKGAAQPILVKAHELFAKSSAKKLAPNWGKSRTEELLKEYK